MMRKYFYFITGLSVFVAFLIIGSIISIGGPGYANAIKLDEKRMQDFNEIRYVVDEYYETRRSLPASLEEALSATGRTVEILDPKTKKQYEYKKISKTEFNLCTEFSTDSRDVNQRSKGNDYINSYGYPSKENHPKGYHCISYDLYNDLNNYEDDLYDEDYYDDEYYDDYYDEETDEYYEEDSEPQASKVQNIKLNVAWQDRNDNVHYTLINAYLSDTLSYDGQDYGTFWVEKENDEMYLVLEVVARNLGTREFYVDTAKIMRLSKNGVRFEEDDYSETNLDGGDTETAYSMFIVDADESKIKLLFGDLQSPQTVDLDFATATESFGILDLQNGFKVQEEPSTSPEV